jgi:hypothetical protein
MHLGLYVGDYIIFSIHRTSQMIKGSCGISGDEKMPLIKENISVYSNVRHAFFKQNGFGMGWMLKRLSFG